MTASDPIARRCLVAVTLLLCACAAEVSQTEDPADVESVHQALQGGTPDNVHRPEVVLFTAATGGKCTATMITRRYFVTAAHCTGYQAGVGGGTITFTALAGSPMFDVDRVFAFAGSSSLWESLSCGKPDVPEHAYCSTGVGPSDVALGRLKSDAPAGGWTPARISTSAPAPNEGVTAWGYGPCATGVPVSRRFINQPYATNIGFTCKGDSGGPLFRADGTIGALVSGGIPGTSDAFADLPNFKLRIQRTIRQLEGGLNPGIDLHAADIPGQAVVITSDAPACRATCQKNAACRAWTWISGTNRCYQKDATADWTPRDDAVSGVIEPIDPFIWGGLDTPFDLPGLNFPNQPVTAANPADCARQCWESTVCRAYTYVSTGAQCWLKSGVPTPSTMTTCATNHTCVSGIKRGPGNRDYSLNDFTAPYPASLAQCQNDCMISNGCQAYTQWNGSCWQKSPAPPAATTATGLSSDVRSGFYYNSQILNLTPYSTPVLVTGMSARPEPHACAALCSRDSRCRSWTMQTQNSTSSMDITCALYDSVGFAYPHDGAVSGVKALQLW
jgi:hypothetical protein